MGQHAVAPGDDELLVGGILLVDVGQGVEAPPGLVVVRPVVEVVPAAVGALGVAVRALAAVVAVAVEVHAVRAGVGEHAVQDDADALLLRRGAELLEVLLRAEGGVDLHVVAGVVLVVAVGLKDGVEVQHRHAHAADVVQLLLDALQVAAEEVVGGVAAALVVDDQRRVVVPVGVVVGAPGQILHVGAAGVIEAVHHDLHHQAVAHPLGGAVGGVVHRDLEGRGLGAGHDALSAQAIVGVAQIPAAAFLILGDKVVPEQAGLLRDGHFVFIESALHPAHEPAVLRVVPPDAQRDGIHLIGAHPKPHLACAGCGSHGAAVLFGSGIVIKRHRLTDSAASDARSCRCTR